MKSSFEVEDLSRSAQMDLDQALGRIINKHRAVMFSGGFDSMLLALLARRGGARVTAVTVRFADFNHRTVAAATLLARRMKLPHHIIHVTLPEFLAAFGSFRKLTDKPFSDFDLVLVHAAFKKYDPQIGGKIFISGMGSDQWFGNEALKGNAKDLKARLDQAAADRDVHHNVAQAHGYKFIFPFLSIQMLALSQQIPVSLKKDKKLLYKLVTRTDTDMLPRLGARREIQVPMQVRHLLVKVYGHQAWPKLTGRNKADEQTFSV